jgi:hypothetical protein
MKIDVQPKANRRIAGWVFVGPAVSAIVIGYFAIGPVSIVESAAVFGAVTLLAWSGPRLNRRLYGPPPAASASFVASAILDHKTGQLEVDRGSLTWRPRRRGVSRATDVAIPLSEVSRVELQPLPGLPRSCRLRWFLADGESAEMSVFSRSDDIARALIAADPIR